MALVTDTTSTTKLEMYYADEDDTEFHLDVSEANPSATAANVKTLMQNIITNRAIYETQPVSIVGAQFVTTTTAPIDLPE